MNSYFQCMYKYKKSCVIQHFVKWKTQKTRTIAHCLMQGEVPVKQLCCSTKNQSSKPPLLLSLTAKTHCTVITLSSSWGPSRNGSISFLLRSSPSRRNKEKRVVRQREPCQGLISLMKALLTGVFRYLATPIPIACWITKHLLYLNTEKTMNSAFFKKTRWTKSRAF